MKKKRFNLNPEEVLENVVCARAHNSEQQLELLSDAAAIMCDDRFVVCYHIRTILLLVPGLL